VTGPTVLALALALPAAPAPPPPPEYEFVPRPPLVVVMIRGEDYVTGRLDSAGNFIETPGGRRKRSDPYSGLRPLNSSLDLNEPVYEYRSGRLIRGILDSDGNFVPDLNGRVIDFKNYRYGKSAPRIYNLPGVFEKKGEKD
jgi:hypothetical protein